MRIGLDLGGTKIEVIALDDHGATVFRERCATPANDYSGILEAIAALIGRAEHSGRAVEHVGVATPGSISPATGLLRNSNTVVLNGMPFRQDLASRLRKVVRIENDANCLALSEAQDGVAADARVVFAVILGTGVGGGLVIDNRLITGRNYVAGEWGHNPLPWRRETDPPQMRCYCGKSGCIETYLSGIGLTRLYESFANSSSTPPQIARSAASGDPTAMRAMDAYADGLARALASVINVVDPDAIVLGGGLSNIDGLYENVSPRLSRYVFSDAVTTPVLRALHGDSSGVRGAAWLNP
ncbi:MAG TPA: ROK family protein [Steroidobacteraceae bacterium]|jgi:fructokinase|nr:ROK family protein [Steroidobacteraceae bacterium]